MILPSEAFRYSAVIRAGFRTVLCHAMIVLKISDIFRYDEGEKSGDENGLDVKSYDKLFVKVMEFDSYTLNGADLKETEEYDLSAGLHKAYNFATVHFTTKNYEGLEFRILARKDFFANVGSTLQFRNLVKQLINRFDRGNKEALSHFDKGDVAGFAKAAHPLVSDILYRLQALQDSLLQYSPDDGGVFNDGYPRDLFGTDDEENFQDGGQDITND